MSLRAIPFPGNLRAEFVVADSIPQLIWVSDPEGSVIYVNRRWCEFTGARDSERLRAHWQEHVHPDDLPQVLDRFQAARESGGVLEAQCRIRDKDGAYVWHGMQARPVLEGGRPAAWCASFTDISEIKKAEEVLANRAALGLLRADIGTILTHPLSLREMLTKYAEAIVKHLGAAFARIWLLDEEAQVLHLEASAGMYTHIDGAHRRVPVGRYKIGLIAQERKPHLTNSVVGDPRVHDQEWAKREGMVAFAGYPLMVEGKVIGVVAFFARKQLAEEVIDGLGWIAGGMAQAIERKRAEQKLEEQQELARALSTPVLPLRRHLLVVPLVGLIDSIRAQQLTNQLLTAIRKDRARAVVLDLTGVPAVDAAVAQHLLHAIKSAQLLGATVVLSGISRATAQRLADVGSELREFRTASDLQSGLEQAEDVLGRSEKRR